MTPEYKLICNLKSLVKDQKAKILTMRKERVSLQEGLRQHREMVIQAGRVHLKKMLEMNEKVVNMVGLLNFFKLGGKNGCWCLCQNELADKKYHSLRCKSIRSKIPLVIAPNSKK